MNQQFRNIAYMADRSGTSKWRRIWAYSLIDCQAQNLNIQADYSQTPIFDQRYYQGVNSVTIQRWISDGHRQIVDNILRPAMDRNSGWLIYEIDDLMDAKFIPLYNRGRGGFESPKIQDNIKHMLNEADIVTVTTDYIKESYNKYYDVPLDKIVSLPNMLPRFLFGDRYNPNLKIEQFKKNKSKPRIGVVSSLSHYNISDVRKDKDGYACRKQISKGTLGNDIVKWINQNGVEIPESETTEIQDDMDIILDCIKQTINDFQWVIFGYAPPKLKKEVDEGKIEVHGGTPIMNYPSVFDNLALQAVIAPIQDIEFNRCKSFIKYMECAALGVPLFASNTLPYIRVMPEKQLFKDWKELKEKLLNLKFSSVGAYQKIIENQWKWLNSPCHEGDFDIRNFWMEDNLGIWIELSRLRQRCNECSLEVYLKVKKEREEKKKEQTIYSNENGVEILK